MNTLYWITVLGNIYGFSLGMLIILILIIIFLSIYGFTSENIYTNKDDMKIKDICFKIVKKLALCSIIPTLILIFVPSKNQLYAIYGVGTVIDYAKGSKEAQKLPDNAVKALNVWLENINKDKKDSINTIK